ncbi:adenosylcobinamide amidohydrolase [Brevibacillus sp. B_LB10_24]|uniref:adenosylcobinamide amidohydrolase n=1 Tax=Brevibacillus sp. B_LB10_24 TaxID=3380645 RepID=UPI0038BA7182
MSQPFRQGVFYQSQVWPEVSVEVKQQHLLIRTAIPLETLSSALWGGGVSCAHTFVNWYVDKTYRSTDPEAHMREQIEQWGYQPDATIGLQTAAKLTHAAVAEEAGDAFDMVCCTTAGTSNAARAGKVERIFSAYQTGTINTFLFVNGRMTPAAMVNALLTASEAKAAALQDLQLLTNTGEIATGTTSDSFVLAVSQQGYPQLHPYAGTATSIGDAAARLVYQTVREAAATQWEE